MFWNPAWNSSREVATARTAAKSLGAEQVVIFYRINDKSGDKLGYASFGTTPAGAEEARKLADVAYDAIFGMLIAALGGGACHERMLRKAVE